MNQTDNVAHHLARMGFGTPYVVPADGSRPEFKNGTEAAKAGYTRIRSTTASDAPRVVIYLTDVHNPVTDCIGKAVVMLPPTTD